MGTVYSTTNTGATQIAINGGQSSSTIFASENKSGRAVNRTSLDTSAQAELHIPEEVNPPFKSMFKNLKGKAGKAKRKGGFSFPDSTAIHDTVQHLTGLVTSKYEEGSKEFDHAVSTADKYYKNFDAMKVGKGENFLSEFLIEDVKELIKDNVEALPQHSTEFIDIATSLSGISNNEVSILPTPSSISKAVETLTAEYDGQMSSLIKKHGSKFNVFPDEDEVDAHANALSSTLGSVSTKYGQLDHLSFLAKCISEDRRSIRFSILHTKGSILAKANYLPGGMFKLEGIAGSLLMFTPPYTAPSAGLGHVFSGPHLVTITGTTGAKTTSVQDPTKVIKQLALSQFGFVLPEVDTSRKVVVVITGYISITSQKASNEGVTIVLYYIDATGTKRFSPAVFLNVASTLPNAPKVSDKLTSIGYTTKGSTQPDTANLVTYGSFFEVKAELSNSIMFDPVTEFGLSSVFNSNGNVNMVLAASYPSSVTFTMTTFFPSVIISIVGSPKFMKFYGINYDGTILDLLGRLPTWYVTTDPHDPSFIYNKMLGPLIIRATAIADYFQTRPTWTYYLELVAALRLKYGLSILTQEALNFHLYNLFSTIGTWLYVDNPISEYPQVARVALFQKIVENAMFLVHGNISIWAPVMEGITTNYLQICDALTKQEEKLLPVKAI